MEQIPIKTEYIRLDALLKYAGTAETGGEAKQQILQGGVSVNGQVCLQRGRKLRPGDAVQISGCELTVVDGRAD